MKNVNWANWANVSFVATFVCAAIGWGVLTIIRYEPLPAQVTDHERRITVLESQSATNQVRLDDRLDRIDSDIRDLSRRVDRMGGGYDDIATNAGYAVK